MKLDRYSLISIVSVLLAVAIWYLTTVGQTQSHELLFPSLTSVIDTFFSNAQNLIEYSFITWSRMLLGLMIGVFAGFIIGILMTCNKVIEAITDPIIEILRPIPPFALIPFFILWFGLSDVGLLLLIALGCFMVTVVSVVNSIKNTNPLFVQAAKLLGANKLQLYLTIYIPAIMPEFSSVLRVASATGFGLTVAAEYMGAQSGLGFMIRNARVILETDTILLVALLLGLLSFITDLIIRKVFQHLIRWSPQLNT